MRQNHDPDMETPNCKKRIMRNHEMKAQGSVKPISKYKLIHDSSADNAKHPIKVQVSP